ncbi:M20 family metallopeptidase [Nocardioides iriomotensis]|uniref:M20 family peptidase n=1 Tax=Nocardioides iriomotensis TaxID=715784 RepID=A0A4V1Z153_9ACTN|nr:M20 family metallopeptidase [Nocardioides iriomotensis]RYU09706.1 M20 family peptidase [Nocardioides iriomotensis]
MSRALLTQATERVDAILRDVVALVEVETSSYDKAALDRGLDHVDGLLHEHLGDPSESRRHDGGDKGDVLTATYAGSGGGHVSLLAHYDTVWPTGTLAGWPVTTEEVDSGLRTTGPGIFDMKTGLVQGIWALRLLRESGAPTPTVTFVLNGDEEIGSIFSRQVIEAVATGTDATLVLEPSVGGAVKTGRKGIGIFGLETAGVESHAGLDPEAGASAIHSLARVIGDAARIARPEVGTTVNVGLVEGGSGSNVVAGRASALVDVRVADVAEQDRVDREFDALETGDDRVSLTVKHGWNRPPMTLGPASRPLLDLAQAVAADLGSPLRDVSVGGASDANFVAALGKPVLCGLGAVGQGAHARGEYIDPATVPHQTALVAGLLGRLAEGMRPV